IFQVREAFPQHGETEGFDLMFGVRKQFALVQRSQTLVIVNVIQQRFCEGGFGNWLVHCESPVARFWTLSGTGHCGGKLPPSRWQREFKIKQMGGPYRSGANRSGLLWVKNGLRNEPL